MAKPIRNDKNPFFRAISSLCSCVCVPISELVLYNKLTPATQYLKSNCLLLLTSHQETWLVFLVTIILTNLSFAVGLIGIKYPSMVWPSVTSAGVSPHTGFLYLVSGQISQWQSRRVQSLWRSRSDLSQYCSYPQPIGNARESQDHKVGGSRHQVMTGGAVNPATEGRMVTTFGIYHNPAGISVVNMS